MRIFILTGEPSGDLHGARLAQALTVQHPAVELLGVGGTRMRRAGVRLLMESEHWGVIGIAAALGKLPYLLSRLHAIERILRADPPDVLVPIDFGAFNMHLLRRLNGGIPTVYYIPPGCWSRHRQPGQLPFLVQAVATPFPWSADNLRAAGAPARVEWVGHPILEYTQVGGTREEARSKLSLRPDRPTVAVVPGSRQEEVRRLLPVFIGALQRLSPAPQVLLTVAPSLGEPSIREILARAGAQDLEIRLLDGIDYAQVRAADAALAASGTATLELACLDVPMVIAYRSSFATLVQFKIAVRGGQLRFIGLPNILADAPVVPELLQDAATPDALAEALTPLLTDMPARRAQLDAFAGIRANLGDGHACEKAARLVLEVGGQILSS
ncbi:MAG: lipid-A-disaccharide synthase [Armatimonadota bacterium]